jgi:hypothetical protein
MAHERYGIMCEVYGGITGHRTGLLRRDDVVVEFTDLKTATAEAEKLERRANTPYATATFRYRPTVLNSTCLLCDGPGPFNGNGVCLRCERSGRPGGILRLSGGAVCAHCGDRFTSQRDMLSHRCSGR